MTCLVNLNYNHSSKKNMKDCLVLSSGKNKSSVFNGLQAKMTGSNPVALTTFPNLNSGNKYNDLANNSLKTLPNLKHLVRRWSEYTLITICKIRSKNTPKSIKVSCKCLVKISRVHRDRARGSQVCVFFLLVIISIF